MIAVTLGLDSYQGRDRAVAGSGAGGGEEGALKGTAVARIAQARNIYILIQICSFATHLKSAPGVPNVCSVNFLEGSFSSGE
jgi:hypothetical protein